MILAFGDVNSPLILPRIAILKELGEDIVVVANADCREIAQNDFKTIKPYCFKNRTVRYLVNTLFTFWLILKYRPKLIVVHWASRLYQTLAFLPFSNRLVVSCMGGDIDTAQDFKGKKAFWASLLLRNAAVITVKSEYMRQMLISNVAKIDEAKIHKIGWGVEPIFASEIKDGTVEEFAAGSYLFFCARAMRPFYRKDWILQAFVEFKRATKSDAKLLISAYGADTEYLSMIQEMIGRCGYESDILTLDIKHERMPAVLSSVDALVSFAPADGLPQSFLEALYVGKFVIASKLENYIELLSDENSRMCEDISELIEAFVEAEKSNQKPVLSEKVKEILDYQKQSAQYLEICKKIKGGL